MSETDAFLDYIKQVKSNNTYKTYRAGLKKFEEFYGKSCDEALQERREDIASGDFERNKRFAREIEKFHAWLLKEKQLSINSARTSTTGILQLFRYYGMTVQPEGDVRKTVTTTKDFVPTIEQYRSAYNCADLQTRVIISLGLDLGWRIGDVLSIQKDQIPHLDQKPPIPFDLITEKEDVLAKSFLSAETVELLKTYIPTLSDNPYLFPSNNKKHLTGASINYKLREAFKKAKIKIPKRKRLRYHAFRKRFLSTCADLKIDVNTAKILVGKSVEKSMLAYLSEVQHKAAFKEVREEALSLTNGKLHSEIDMKDAAIEKLQKRIEQLEQIQKGMVEIYGEEILEKAMKKLSIAKHSGKPVTVLEALQILGQLKEAEDKAEYEKMIENGNGNNNH